MLTFKESVSPQVKVRYVKVKHLRYFDKTIFDTESWSDDFCCVTAVFSVLQSFSCRSAIC